MRSIRMRAASSIAVRVMCAVVRFACATNNGKNSDVSGVYCTRARTAKLDTLSCGDQRLGAWHISNIYPDYIVTHTHTPQKRSSPWLTRLHAECRKAIYEMKTIQLCVREREWPPSTVSKNRAEHVHGMPTDYVISISSLHRKSAAHTSVLYNC